MSKKLYCLKSAKGEIIKSSNGSYLLFEYPEQAFQYRRRNYNNSPYINIDKFEK